MKKTFIAIYNIQRAEALRRFEDACGDPAERQSRQRQHNQQKAHER